MRLRTDDILLFLLFVTPIPIWPYNFFGSSSVFSPITPSTSLHQTSIAHIKAASESTETNMKQWLANECNR